MAWTNLPLPVDANVDITDWDFFKQFPYAIRERFQGSGDEQWPGGSINHDGKFPPVSLSTIRPGYDGAITNDPVSVAGGTRYRFTDVTQPGWADSRWYDWPVTAPYVPQFYDLVVDCDEYDPSQVIRAPILASGNNWVEVDSKYIDDAITFGQVTLLSFKHKRFRITRQNTVSHPAYDWASRMPPWPNCRELAKGFVGAAGTTFITEVSGKKEETFTPVAVEIGDVFRLVVTGGVGGPTEREEFEFVATADTASNVVAGWKTLWGQGKTRIVKAIDAFAEGDVFRVRAKKEGTAFNIGVITRNADLGTSPESVVRELVQDNYQAQYFKPGIFAPGGPFGPCELMVKGDGRWRRIPILDNAEYTIAFAPQTFTPEGFSRYSVIRAGGKWRYIVPRYADYFPKYYNQPSQPQLDLWYGGRTEPLGDSMDDPRYYSRHPDGMLRATPFAAESITLMQMDGGSGLCLPETIDGLMDWDFVTAVDDECSKAEFFHAPMFNWCIRGWQVAIRNAMNFYVEDKSYNNLGAIPDWKTATWYRAANVNHVTTTISGQDAGGIDLSGIVPLSWVKTPAMVVWLTILDARGMPMLVPFGEGVDDLTSSVDGLSRIGIGGTGPEHVGKTIVLSAGPSRTWPKEFRYLYDTWYFVPEFDVDRTYDPPTVDHPGLWIFRPRSTKYKWYNNLGFAQDNDTPVFQNNDLARYVGDNCDDRTTDDNVQNGMSKDTPYRDRANVSFEPYRVDVREGKISSGGNFWIEDDLKSWWEGTLYTHSGVSTSGGAGSLTDSTKAANGFWVGASARNFTGFVLEILDDQDGIINAFPITAHAGTTVSFVGTAPTGSRYRIREPKYLRNRWRARGLQIVRRKTGQVFNLVITHNTDRRLFFAPLPPDVVFERDDTYQIIELQPGAVVQYQSSTTQWLLPTGNDPRGKPFVIWPNNNEPHYFTGYGFFRNGDRITATLINELFRCIDVVHLMKKTGYWTMYAEDFNRRGSDLVVLDSEPITWDHLKTEIVSHFDAAVATGESLELPRAATRFFSGITGNATRAYMYAVLDNAPTVRYAHTAHAYVYASTDKYDVGEYGPGDNPDAPTDSQAFNNQGDNVYYRAFGLVSSIGPTFNSFVQIKVGDNVPCPTAWPPEPPGEGSPDWFSSFAGWSVAINPISGTESPIILLSYKTPGGFNYQTGIGLPLPGTTGLSGLAPLTT